MSTSSYVPSSRRQRIVSFLWSVIAILFGWSLFLFWWGRVLTLDQPDALFRLLYAIAIFVAILLAATGLWIWHNLRIARRGTRGLATRYQVRVYERDALGRTVSLPLKDGAHRAAMLTVNTVGDIKTYRETYRRRPIEGKQKVS